MKKIFLGTIFLKFILFKSSKFICLTFLFLNLADVAINISISPKELSKLLNTLLFLIISFAPTDVANILSLGK